MVLNQSRLNARVARVRSAVLKDTKYKLGKGGFFPKSPLPHDANRECDCSGYVSWGCELRRDQVNAKKWWSKLLPWIETTNVYRDATKTKRVFVQIVKPVPGCIVVYGDRGRAEGHIGIVTTVSLSGSITVVDCSSGQYRRTGQAITERNGDFFVASGAIFCVLKEDFA